LLIAFIVLLGIMRFKKVDIRWFNSCTMISY
jgi:hypothetical protein